MILSFWEGPSFQGRSVSFREGFCWEALLSYSFPLRQKSSESGTFPMQNGSCSNCIRPQVPTLKFRIPIRTVHHAILCVKSYVLHLHGRRLQIITYL